jgi:hypothetical protein
VGYHVPSAGERNQLLIAWAADKGITLNGSDYKEFSSNETQNFNNDFLLPLAGSRLYSSADLVNTGSYGSFWSSSPSSTSVRYLDTDTFDVFAGFSMDSTVGLSVRCFKNISDSSIVSVVYDPDQETLTTGSVTVTVTLNQDGAALSGWTISGAVFTKVFHDNWA